VSHKKGGRNPTELWAFTIQSKFTRNATVIL
jgi:hypothetical protein